MRVYRYLSKEELRNILENHTENIGSFFSRNKNNPNTHRYHENEKYIHFYKNSESMQDIRSVYRAFDNDFYFCAFEIPITVLLVCRGKGFYPAHGFAENHTTITEYAVPVSSFKTNWFSGYLPDTERSRIITKEKYANMFPKNTNKECEHER